MFILGHHLGSATTLHGVINELWSISGEGTTSLETKLLQQLMAMSEEFLYDILLDLHNSYYDLDREMFLELIEGYGVRPRDVHMLSQFWDVLNIVVRVEGYYAPPFKGYWVLTQGNPLLITIFNGVVEAVVHN